MERNDLGVAKISRKTNTNKLIFISVCIMIAIIIAVNVVIISAAYFTATKRSNDSVITTGNVNISYVVKNSNNETITAPLDLGSNSIIPGQENQYSLVITNSGNNSCYVRMKALFEIYENGGYTSNYNSLVQLKTGNASVAFELDNVVYYKQTNSGIIEPLASVTIPIKFVVNETASQELVSLSSCTYRITLTIQALQSQGVTQSETYGWIDSQNNVISF